MSLPEKSDRWRGPQLSQLKHRPKSAEVRSCEWGQVQRELARRSDRLLTEVFPRVIRLGPLYSEFELALPRFLTSQLARAFDPFLSFNQSPWQCPVSLPTFGNALCAATRTDEQWVKNKCPTVLERDESHTASLSQNRTKSTSYQTLLSRDTTFLYSQFNGCPRAQQERNKYE